MRLPAPLLLLILTTSVSFLPFAVTGQLSTGELPTGILKSISLENIPHISVPFDASLIDKNLERQEYPMFAGVSIPVNKLFGDYAAATILEDGSTLFHLEIHVPNAKTIGLVFSGFHIPANDKFFIYSKDGKYTLGAFIHSLYPTPSYFSTHILPVETLILEYHSADYSKTGLPDFYLDEIIKIINSPLETDHESAKSSGDCNVNINCPEGDNWQKQKRGIARILLRSGTGWFNCSGSLVNNTNNDGYPYFLTADHCGVHATEEDLQVWQFYFNYEYPECENTGSAPTNMMLTGATIVARAGIQQGTDFKLLELNQDPPLDWYPFFNGWSLSGREPEWGVGIHHPSGDAKKISHFLDPATTSTFTGGMQQGYWRVVWSATGSGHGITEGGSSGSPIFDNQGLIRGRLTGRGASCNNPGFPDFYGKFYRHWMANGETASQQLKPWLDPLEENPEMLFGYDPNFITNFVMVDIAPPLSGNITGSGFFAENELVSLFAKASEGFIFINWTDETGQAISTNNPLQFFMPQNQVQIMANFEIFSNLTELPEKPDFTIFPNPATDYIHIQLEKHTSLSTIKIFTLAGHLIYQKVPETTYENQLVSIPIGSFSPGIYFISLSSANFSAVKKVVLSSPIR